MNDYGTNGLRAHVGYIFSDVQWWDFLPRAEATSVWEIPYHISHRLRLVDVETHCTVPHTRHGVGVDPCAVAGGGKPRVGNLNF